MTDERKLSFRVLLPPEDRLLTRADLIECLCPPLDSWDVIIGLPRALHKGRLVARHANSFRVDSSRAQYSPGDFFFLARDVGAWFRGEGCSVVHQIDVSEPGADHDATQRIAAAVDTPPTSAESADARKQRLRARRDQLKADRVRGFNVKLAAEEKISVTRLKELLGDAPKRRKQPVIDGLFPPGPTRGRRR
jgi:hypothetical protein